MMLVLALLAGALASCLLLLWMQHLGKFWIYSLSYGVTITFVAASVVAAFAVSLMPPFLEAARVLLPACSLVCWRYMSYISKGIVSPHSVSGIRTTTLQSLVSPMSVGLGVAIGFLLAWLGPSVQASHLPLLVAGLLLGPACYAVCVRLTSSYVETILAYKAAALLLVVGSFLSQLLGPYYGLAPMVVLIALSWSYVALFISLTAAVVRNPRRQIYNTCCRGSLWLFLGLMVGIALSALAEGAHLSEQAISLLVQVYVVVLCIVALLMKAGSRKAPDYQETAVMGSFAQSCLRVTEEYGLTKREAEVMGYVARGKTAKRIAEELVLSPATVHTHISHIYRKVGVNSKEELLDVIEGTRRDPAGEDVLPARA